MKRAPNNYFAFRDDIQILRAIAIIFVVLYHAQLPFLKSGFLGVDIFFVISGYLIGGIVIKETAQVKFSFQKFYLRRAWRLLPAAYITFLLSILLSPLFLTDIELKDVFWQVISALTFTSNIVLWQQAGYFGGDASLKPLLHTWSLAIEEQFYIFLPPLLVALKGKTRFAAIAGLALLSFVLAIILRESASAAFYLLPTRAWELLVGVVVANVTQNHGPIRTPNFFYFLSFLFILVIPFFDIFAFHPGPQAALLCLAVAIILASQPHNFTVSGMNIILYIGTISYSVYLVHWPLFAFFNNMNFNVPWSSQEDAMTRISILLCSFVLAGLLNHNVEERFRAEFHSGKKLLLFSGVPATALVALLVLSPSRSKEGDVTIDSASQVCETSGRFSLDTACQTDGEPRILVWGDSYAMHLVPGLAGASSSLEIGITHATKSACGPFLGVAQKKLNGGYNQSWAKTCIEFNESVLKAVRLSNTVDVVVLSSPFSYIINNPEGLFTQYLVGGQLTWQPANFELAVQALSKTIEQLRKVGKRVIIIAPPPSGGFDMGRCGRRLIHGLPKTGVDQNCRFDRVRADQSRSGPDKLLATVSDRYNVEVIQLGDLTCSASTCESVIGETSLYVDGGHLSREGSVWIAGQMDLRKMVWDLAN